jgi:hypothetical protein
MTRIGTWMAGACLLALAGCGGSDGGAGNEGAAGGAESTAVSGGTGNQAASGGAESMAGSDGASASGDASGGAGGGVRLQPGEWEMGFEMIDIQAPGMPAGAADMMKKRKTTVKSCISEADANKPGPDIFQPEKGSNCKAEGYSAKDGRIAGTMTCPGTGGTGGVTLVMDGEYGPTRFDVTTRTEMKGEGTAITTKTRSTGRRLGDCPAGVEDPDVLEDNLGKKRKAG